MFSSVELIPLDMREMTKEGMSRMMWLLRPAVEMMPEGSMPHLLQDAMAEECVIWAIAFDNEVRGAIVTRMIQYENGYTVFLVQAAATDKKIRMTSVVARDLMEYFEEFAAHQGADAVRIIGRKGWGRVLKGYTELERTFEKPLAREGH